MATTSTYLIAAALALLGTAATTQARLQCRFDRNSTADDCLYTVKSGYRNLRWKNATSDSMDSGAIVLSGTYGFSEVLLTGIRSSVPPVCVTYGLRRSTNALFRVLSENGTALEPRPSSLVTWELDLEDNQSVTFEGTLWDDVEYITLSNVTAYDHMTCDQMRTGLTQPAVNSVPIPNNNQPASPHFPNVSHTDNNPHMPIGTYPSTPHPMPNGTYPSTPHPMPNGTYPSTPNPMPNGTYPSTPHPMPNSTYPPTPHPMPNGTYPPTPHPMPNGTYPSTPHPMPNGTYPSTPHPMPNGTYPPTPHPMPNGTYPSTPYPMPNGTYPYPPHFPNGSHTDYFPHMPNGTYPYPPYFPNGSHTDYFPNMPNGTYPYPPYFPNGSHTDYFPNMPNGTYPYNPHFPNGSHTDYFPNMPNGTYPYPPHFPNGSHTDYFPNMPNGTYPYPPDFPNGGYIDHFYPVPNDNRPPHRPPPHHINALPPFYDQDMDEMEPFCPDSPLRLSGGIKSFGRVEVCNAGGWGTVCSDGWTAHNTRVFCNTLGFRDGIRMNLSDTPNAVDANLRISLDGVRCKPHHRKMWHCCHNEIGVHDCDHSQDVVLSCFGEFKPPCNRSLDPDCSFEHPMKPTPTEPEQPDSYDYTAFIEVGQMSSETLDGYDYMEPMPMSPEQAPEVQIDNSTDNASGLLRPPPCRRCPPGQTSVNPPAQGDGDEQSPARHPPMMCDPNCAVGPVDEGLEPAAPSAGPSPPSAPCTNARDPRCRQSPRQ